MPKADVLPTGSWVQTGIGEASVRQARTLKIIAEEMELEPVRDLADSYEPSSSRNGHCVALRTRAGASPATRSHPFRQQQPLGRHSRALRSLNSDWERPSDARMPIWSCSWEHFGEDDPNYINAEVSAEPILRHAACPAALQGRRSLDAIDRTCSAGVDWPATMDGKGGSGGSQSRMDGASARCRGG